jgi:shikimate dehydrogenase
MSRPYAEVIGDPIVQSKSPKIHNFWLGKLGISAEYRACHVRTEELADYFRVRNADTDWRGCNVTMPHKQAVMALLDGLAAEAERIGAVNTIVKRGHHLEGHNTDGVGFMEPLRPLTAGKRYRLAHLVGSGGAAKAIADALYEAQFTIISISRNPEKANREIGRYVRDKDLLLPLEWLNQPVSERDQKSREADVLDVFVNASPLGMAGHPALELNFDRLFANEIVYDIVTHPLDTDLLARARAAGFPTIDGLAMLIGQAAAAFETFFGVAAPRRYDAELRALLTS